MTRINIGLATGRGAMHRSTYVKMEWFVETFLGNGRGDRKLSVLDVGSRDYNGTYKTCFPQDIFDYTGLDIEAGANVDVVVGNPYVWDALQNDCFDVVVSGQTFEHIEFFWFTMQEMVRVLKPGGHACIIAPRGFERHRVPIDTYRFDCEGMIALARYGGLTPLHASTNMSPPGASREWCPDESHSESLLVAQKPSIWPGIATPREYRYVPADLRGLAGNFAVPRQREPYIALYRVDRNYGCGESAVESFRKNGVVIYGASETGFKVCTACVKNGIPVHAFCDDVVPEAAKNTVNVADAAFSVVNPATAVGTHPSREFIIATWQQAHVKAMLKRLGGLGVSGCYIASIHTKNEVDELMMDLHRSSKNVNPWMPVII